MGAIVTGAAARSARDFDCRRTIRVLQDAVEEYRAAPHLVDLVTTRRAELGLDVDNVTALQSGRRANTAHPPSAQPGHAAPATAVADLTSITPSASA